MNLQRLPEYVLRWSVTIGGLLTALLLAKKLGDGNIGQVTLVLVAFAASAITLAAKDRIWLLIPAVWGLTGNIPALNLPFAAKDLVVMWVFVSTLIFQAFKIITKKPSFQVVDFLCGSMLLYLIITWIRNPVGVEALQSDRVGGRPYFDAFIAGLACYVLSRSRIGATGAKRLPFAMAGGRMFDGIAAVILEWIPQLVILTLYYNCSIFSLVEGIQLYNPNQMVGGESAERLGYLGFIGYPLLLLLAVRYPLKSFVDLTRPWLPALLGLGIICVLLSGFRSAIIACAGAFFVAGYLRKGWTEPARLLLIGGLAYAFLAIGNGILFNLPRSAQRALTWLPGNWDEVAKMDAKGSTEWRTEMWKIMLTTNVYIDSHMFGDGFGFKRRDYERMVWIQMYGGPDSQEMFMVSGGVHSGPVSAIRFVGYVGLALHLCILILLAREALRVARRALGTKYEALALFICIPAIIEPLYFTLIFGAFENSVTNSLFVLGLLHMLRNSMDDYVNPSLPELVNRDTNHPPGYAAEANAAKVT